MPHDPYGQHDNWRDQRWRRERQEIWGNEDRSFSDRERHRQPEYMSRREAEDFSRRVGEGEWGWGARGHSAHDRHLAPDRDGRRDRGFVEEVKDAVQSVFNPRHERAGHERYDYRGHRGRGPRGYYRSDSRIQEDACDRLTEDPYLDASDVEVRVQEREITLAGHVASREDKRRAERLVEDIPGVQHVQNNLRVEEDARERGYGSARGTAPLISGAGADQEAAAFLSGARDRDNL